MKSGLDKVKSLARATVNWWSRSLWLEILAFVAVAIFAFSVVSTLLDKDESIVALAAPDLTLQQAADVPALYEAESQRATTVSKLSPVFTPSVLYWEDEIVAWASEWGIDPNAAATLMQIESCGNPSAQSWAGATGLFQVMPFHFSPGEEMQDPNTNARRGMAYLALGMEQTGGDTSRTFAGYNGGHGTAARGWETWPAETQRYYVWSTGIYKDAVSGSATSETLNQWLAAGGAGLCQQAAARLGLQ